MRGKLLLPLITLLTSACLSEHLRPPPGAELLLAREDAEPLPEPPDFVRAIPAEWLRLTSGEWLRGEFEVMNRQVVQFDSEELDDLSLDWEDVAEVHTQRSFTVLLENRAQVTGKLDVVDDVVQVTREDGMLSFRRKDVQRIVRGALREWDYWSGDVKLGFTARRGNTDQTDLSIGASTKRRTGATRFQMSVDVLQSEQGGSETANSQRFRSNYDVYLTSRLYLTPIALEVYSDRFQNIDLRVTPSTGLGYTLVDRPGLEWTGAGGYGYRWTRFDSVAPGEDREMGEGVFILTTAIDADLTEKIELDASYTVQLSPRDLDRTQQDFELELSYDVWRDLDFVLGFLWSRVGDPEPDANGNTPEPDDFRMDVGLSWSF